MARRGRPARRLLAVPDWRGVIVRAALAAASAIAPRCGRRPGLRRRRLVLQAGRGQDRGVAVLLEPQGQVLAAAGDDAPGRQDVDHVRLDVVEQALVVGDHQHAHVRVEHGVHALGHDAQGVDVQARVGLVEDRHLGLQDGHLEHLEALLLAAGEALVDVARGDRLVHLEQGHLLLDELAELAHRDAARGARPWDRSSDPG